MNGSTIPSRHTPSSVSIDPQVWEVKNLFTNSQTSAKEDINSVRKELVKTIVESKQAATNIKVEWESKFKIMEEQTNQIKSEKDNLSEQLKVKNKELDA